MENDMDQRAGVEEEREPQEGDSYIPVVSERNLPTKKPSLSVGLVWCLLLDRLDVPWWAWAMFAFVVAFHTYSVWGMRRKEAQFDIGPLDVEGVPKGAHILYDGSYYEEGK